MICHQTNMFQPAACRTLNPCSALWSKLQLDVWPSRLNMLQAEQVSCALARLAGQIKRVGGETHSKGKFMSTRALVWMQGMLCAQEHCVAGSADLTA